MKNNNQNLFFWGICLILCLPIIILPPSFQPSSWSKAILLRSILTILISFFLFKFLYKKEISFSAPRWKNPVYLPFLMLLAFFITLILATLFSEDIRFSIFGSPTRAGGVMNLLFFLIFTIFLTLFINEENWKKLFNLLFVVGILVSSLAVVQYFNILKNVFLSYEAGGTPSFLGNSTFLAIYMLFLVFLSLTFFTQEKVKKRKIFYAALSSLFIFIILITGARATYLGLLIGFFFFFFFYPVKLPEGQIQPFQKRAGLFNWVNPKKFKTLKIAAASLVLFAVIIAVFLNLFPQIAEKNNLLKIAVQRLSVKNVGQDLLGTRLSVWKITLQMIKDKPLFGWGPENFYIGFEKYYDPTISGIKNLWWDRPHNVFLDIAASSGIISVVIYSLFWLVLLWQLQIFKRRQGDDKRTYLAHGLQAMFIGYLTALFFNFDDFSTYLISFFFIGCSFYLISKQSEGKIIFPVRKGLSNGVYPPKINFAKNKFVYIPFLPLLFGFIWFWNIKPLYLNENIVRADNLINIKKCEKAINIMDGIWQSKGILRAHAGLKYADFIRKCVPLQPEKEIEYISTGSEALKGASIARPKFTRTWMFLGGFTNVLAAREENAENRKKLLLEARDEFEKALELSPKRQEIFIEMEKSYLMLENYQTMKKIAYDCIKIDESYGQCYWYLGIAEIFLGDQENGKKHIEKSQEGSAVTPSYVQLGAAYISQKNYIDAAEAYRRATVFNDDKNASYRAVLAFLYKQIGKYEEAGAEAIKVFKLQPENKEAPEFLKQLLGFSPNNVSLHSSLAYVYSQIGETEKARQEYLIVKSFYLQAVAKNPKAPDYHFSLALVYKELGEYEKAYQEALLAKKLYPKYWEKVDSFIDSLPEEYHGRY